MKSLIWPLLACLILHQACAVTWSGQVCSRTVMRLKYQRVCRYRWWGSCASWRTVRVGYWTTEYFCCTGWRHNGDQVCNIPICSPSCQNNGTCISPGTCRCVPPYTGQTCNSVAATTTTSLPVADNITVP